MKIHKGVVCNILAAGIILFYANIISAGLQISQAITEIVVSPETVTIGEYEVTNDGTEKVRVKVEIEDWLKKRTGTSSVPLDRWLSITPVEFDLEAFETKKVEYAITPPKDYNGELVAMIFFGTTAEFADTGSSLASRLGVSLYVAMEGTFDLTCLINDVKVEKFIIQEREQRVDRGIIFFLDIENKGTVHIRPTGKVVVTSNLGKTYDVKIERGFPIYPGKNVVHPVFWEIKDISPGKYEAMINLDYGNIYKVDKKLEKKLVFTVKEDGSISF